MTQYSHKKVNPAVSGSTALQIEESFSESAYFDSFQKNLLQLQDKVSHLNFMVKEVGEALSKPVID